MDYTGERMIPDKADEVTFWEHIYRYRFAKGFVKGKAVLDVACGEGYGSKALLAAGAMTVIGIDISAEATNHARLTHGIDARVADASATGLDSESIDVVVSFETIEHLADPDSFLKECHRVLRRGGTLVISTPNKPVYRDVYVNPFHCSELNEQDFITIVSQYFCAPRMYSQVIKGAVWWSFRSLCAQTTCWRQVRGYGRLAKLICPTHFGSNPGHPRPSGVEAILQKDTPFGRLVNPYLVRRRLRWANETPVYLLAVARKSA
jgi:2-polyprenyl-3-methyl-5-hydroxy-6-metoxy-1,4-benzoquinol methylase